MAKEILSGFVATTDEIPAYGGVQLAEEALYEMARAIGGRTLPFWAEHDPLRQIPGKVLMAEPRTTERGTLGVWIEVEVPEGAAIGMRGFSYAAGMVVEELGPADGPRVGFFADAASFTEEEIRGAGELLARQGLRVEAGPYFQFSADPATVVVLSIAADLLISIAGAAIWDAIKGFVRQDTSTEVRLEVTKASGETVRALVRTDDPSVAREAVQDLAPIVEAVGVLIYRDGDWQTVGEDQPGAGPE